MCYNTRMNVYAISDLHLSINNPKPMNIFGQVWDNYLETIEESWKQVNSDDIVLLPGDLSWAMRLEDAKSDLDYISGFSGKKVLLRGNHDYWWKSISAVRAILPTDCYAVQNDALRFGNNIICGSRLWATPEAGRTQSPEDKKIYEREYIRLKMSLEQAAGMRGANDNIFVMTHYPPFNSKFSPSIFTELISGYAPSAVIYGHLHGRDSRCEKLVEIDGIKYYLTSCDLVENRLIKIV